ncbi:MAG: hypothetical protein AAGB11_14095 [Pseudomonadota bacterium]
MRCFDWDRAARLIVERGAQTAAAGLAEDWASTSGAILRDGKPIPEDETYVYLQSTWATPTLIVDDEEIECALAGEEAGYWPETARTILEAQ